MRFCIKVFLLLALIFIGVEGFGQPFGRNLVVGEWKTMHLDYYIIDFCNDGVFKEYLYGKEIISAANTSHKSNRYKLCTKSDTLWLYLTYRNVIYNFEFKRRNARRRAIQVFPNQITYFIFKDAAGIESHVDEYAVLFRKGTERVITKTGLHITYIVPQNYKGVVWVAFNQPDGVKPEYDSTGGAVLRIPENGMLSTSLHEDVFATAQKNYSVAYEAGGKNYINYKTFDKSEPFDSTCCGTDERIALVGGFNQEGREDIEKFFGKKLSGNVFSFFIGTYARVDKNRMFPWLVKE